MLRVSDLTFCLRVLGNRGDNQFHKGSCIVRGQFLEPNTNEM